MKSKSFSKLLDLIIGNELEKLEILLSDRCYLFTKKRSCKETLFLYLLYICHYVIWGC